MNYTPQWTPSKMYGPSPSPGWNSWRTSRRPTPPGITTQILKNGCSKVAPWWKQTMGKLTYNSITPTFPLNVTKISPHGYVRSSSSADYNHGRQVSYNASMHTYIFKCSAPTRFVPLFDTLLYRCSCWALCPERDNFHPRLIWVATMSAPTTTTNE